MQVPLSSRFCWVRRSFYVISYVRLELNALQPSASSNEPSSSNKEEMQRWSHLSGSKRISTLTFFFRWYTSVSFSGPGDTQNTELGPLLFSLSPQNLTYEIILTLGQAFEVAYQLALQAQKTKQHQNPPSSELIETKSSRPVPKPRGSVQKSGVSCTQHDHFQSIFFTF